MRKLAGIVESTTEPTTNVGWICEDKFKYYSNGKWVTIGNNKEESECLPCIELMIGNSEETKKYNIDNLKYNCFIVKINGECGIGYWNHNKGGNIVTLNNESSTHYTILKDGTISKKFKSVDLYYNYISKGGKKNLKDFTNTLIELIDKN